MTISWYYIADSTTHGPVPVSELRDRFRAGQLRPLDLVGCEGMPHWQFAGLLDGLLPTPWGAAMSGRPDIDPGSSLASTSAGYRPLAAGSSADPIALDGLWQRVCQLFEQRLLSQNHAELLAKLLGRSTASSTSATHGQKRARRPQFRRRGQTNDADGQDAVPADGDENEVLDAVACDVADDDNVLDAVDYGEDSYDYDDDTDDDDADDDDFLDAGEAGGDDELGDMSDESDDLVAMDDDLGGMDDISDDASGSLDDGGYGAGGDPGGGGDDD